MNCPTCQPDFRIEKPSETEKIELAVCMEITILECNLKLTIQSSFLSDIYVINAMKQTATFSLHLRSLTENNFGLIPKSPIHHKMWKENNLKIIIPSSNMAGIDVIHGLK